jgi:hypothetical protein
LIELFDLLFPSWFHRASGASDPEMIGAATSSA